MLRRSPLLLVALAASGGAALATAADRPTTRPPPKLEPKNFTEKVARVQDSTRTTTQKIARHDGEVRHGLRPRRRVHDGQPGRAKPGREADEGPQHKVKVGRFWMGKCEVTWDEFDLFWYDETYPEGQRQGARRSSRPRRRHPADHAVRRRDVRPRPRGPPGHLHDPPRGHDVLPTGCRKKTGKIYRLPTEAEWEYACRGRQRHRLLLRRRPEEARRLRLVQGELARTSDPNAEGPHAQVGTKKPNPWGLYDMHGNVAEWCLDQYDRRTPTRQLRQEPADASGR